MEATPPDGTFAVVSAEVAHTCGVWTDGTLTCWSNNDHGLTMPLDGASPPVLPVSFNPAAERRRSCLSVGLMLEINTDGVRTHDKMDLILLERHPCLRRVAPRVRRRHLQGLLQSAWKLARWRVKV